MSTHRSPHEYTPDDYRRLLISGLGSCDSSRRDVEIIGAGISGLVAGSLLMRAGFEVRVYEASHRVGGRIKTLRDGFSSGLYAEAGAMRLPSSHELALRLCRDFNLQLINFPDTDKNTRVYVNRKHFRSSQCVDTAGTCNFGEPYRPISADAVYNRVLASLKARLKPHWDLERLRRFQEEWFSKLDAISLGEYLRAFVPSPARTELRDPVTGDVIAESEQLSVHDIDMIGFWRGAFDLKGSLLEALRHDATAAVSDRYQILGGMDLLPQSFLRERFCTGSDRPMVDYIHFNARVVEVTRAAGTSKYQVRHEHTIQHGRFGDDETTSAADFVVFAVPFAALTHIRLPHDVTARKVHAIRNLHYENATKVILEFSERFWDEERITGGRSYTDLPIRWTFYPTLQQCVPDSRRGLLLASYTLGEDSLRWTSLRPDDRIRFALRNVAELHSDSSDQYDTTLKRYEKLLVGGMSHSWAGDEHSFGAFAMFEPHQETELYDDIWSPEQHMYFAGEHTSLKHGWIEGAIESGIRVAHEVFEDARCT